MKGEFFVVLVSVFLVVMFSFFIYNGSEVGLTGSVILNNSGDLTEEVTEEVVVDITRQQALDSIDEIEFIIDEMEKANFSTLFMEDVLLEAKNEFEKAENAAILRGELNVSLDKKDEARRLLQFVKWRELNYNLLLSYLDQVKERKEQAFLLHDSIIVIENKLKQEGLDGDSELNQMFDELSNAFYGGRYEEVSELLISFREEIELKKSESETINVLKSNARNFFQKYWYVVLIVLILVGFVGYKSYKRRQKRVLKKKIKKIIVERKALIELIKKTQADRFKHNKISGLVYNVRIKKYKERIQEIKEKLPVFEKKLDRLIFKDKRTLNIKRLRK